REHDNAQLVSRHEVYEGRCAEIKPAGVVQPQSTLLVIAYVPSQAVKGWHVRERIKSCEHVRMMSFGERLFTYDLLAIKFSIGELQPDPFRHIVDRRTHAAGGRLRV